MYFVICPYIVCMECAANHNSFALNAAHKISCRGAKFGEAPFVVSIKGQNMCRRSGERKAALQELMRQWGVIKTDTPLKGKGRIRLELSDDVFHRSY